jgi:glycosyltransferase involved in cell wall biosynthesis
MVAGSSMRKFSVVVLSKNNGRTLGHTLLSIVKANEPRGWVKEIIVVDAHSSDNTPRILSMFKNFIRVIYDEGKGIGIARNIGVLSAQGSVVCFVDADCVIGREHFERILEEIENGADLVDVKGGATPAETKIEHLEATIWAKGRAYSEELRRNRCFAGGSFISFKREVFERIGGFWHYPPYGGDDIDFSYRAYRAGFRIEVVEVPSTYVRFRRGVKELIRQQVGWGKGYAYIIAKYRNDKSFWLCYRWNPLVYRLAGSLIPLYPVLSALAAPVKGLILTVRLHNPALMPYWVLRRWAFLYGILREIRKAFAVYGRQ